MSAIEKLPLEDCGFQAEEREQPQLVLSLDPVRISISALERLKRHNLEIVNDLLPVEPEEDMTTESSELADVIHLDQYRGRILPSVTRTQSGVEQRGFDKEAETNGKFYAEDHRRINASREDPRVFEDLFNECEAFIRFRAGRYFLAGGDSEDLMQEATIGFYKAVRDYDASKSSFNSFADLCMKRQLITAIKTATRFKHEPLNGSLSFAIRPAGSGHDDEGGLILGDMIADSGRLPDELVVGNEGLWHLVRSIGSRLSGYEYDVLRMFMEGESYERIGQALGMSTKSVDNALQRAKGKIQAAMEEKDFKSPLIYGTSI